MQYLTHVVIFRPPQTPLSDLVFWAALSHFWADFNLKKKGLAWQGLQRMGCSKLLAEGGYDILILKVEQGLLKNWPQVCVRQGLQGMGCSKLLAKGG